MTHWRKRQDRVLEASGVPPSVVHALDCWAMWMRGGSVGKGYAPGSVGFSSGGITCFDDMDEAAFYVAAQAVDGIVKGFRPQQRDAICVIFLGSRTCYQLPDIDGMVIALLPVIYRGLVARGVA
jgi:hypothetical protein